MGLAVGLSFEARSEIATTSRAIFYGLACVFFLVSAYMIVGVFMYRVVLYADRLEDRGPLRTIIIHRDEIKGWRLQTGSTPSVLLIESTNRPFRSKIGLVFRPDELFDEWFSNVPNLDFEEQKDALIEILNDESLGETTDKRIQVLGSAAIVAKYLNIAGAAIFGWLWFYPRPYDVAGSAAVILPWIALLALRRHRGLIRVDIDKNTPHPGVAFAILMSCLGIGLRSILDFDVLLSTAAVIWPVGLTLLLWGSLIVLDPSTRKQPLNAASLLIFLAAYAYGSAVFANSLVDSAPSVTYKAFVQDMQIQSGKSTTYELTLSKWGPKSSPNTLDVGPKTYSRLHKDQAVTIVVRTGLLGIRWYYVQSPPA